MAASFQAKDSQTLNQQLKVQEVCLFANNSMVSVDAGDLLVFIGEPVASVLQTTKQVAAGTLTGVVGAPNTTNTSIRITGEAAAAATTSYVIKYTVVENA